MPDIFDEVYSGTGHSSGLDAPPRDMFDEVYDSTPAPQGASQGVIVDAASGGLENIAGLGYLGDLFTRYMPGPKPQDFMDLGNLVTKSINPEAKTQEIPSVGDATSQVFDALTGIPDSTHIGQDTLAHKIGNYGTGFLTMGGGGILKSGVKEGAVTAAKLLGTGALSGTGGYVGQELGGTPGEVIGSLLFGLSPSTLKSGYTAIENIFSAKAKEVAAKNIAADLVGTLSNKADLIASLEAEKVREAATPWIQRQGEKYLPQYQRTAEITGDVGAAGLEQSLIRTDPLVKSITTAEDIARETARRGIYERANPNPFTDEAAGNAIRGGLEANAKVLPEKVSELAGQAFKGGEEIVASRAKARVTGMLNEFLADGSRQVTSDFQNLVNNFRALPKQVDLKTLQNYRSSFGEYAGGGGSMATTQERATAKIAGGLRDSIDTIVENAALKGELPKSQYNAWRGMIETRKAQGTIFESGVVGDVLKKDPYGTRYKIEGSEVPKATFGSPETAREVTSALGGQSAAIKARRSAYMANVWEKSTNATSGELIPGALQRELRRQSDIAPEILTPSQVRVFGKIADDMTSQGTVKRNAYRASQNQSITSEAESLIKVIHEGIRAEANTIARKTLEKIPFIGRPIGSVLERASDPERVVKLVNSELAKFVLDPDAAMLLLKHQRDIPPSMLERLRPLGERLSKIAGVTATANLSGEDPDLDDEISIVEEKPLAAPSIISARRLSDDSSISEVFNSGSNDSDMQQLAERLAPKVIQQESGGNPDALSEAGAVGLMQILPSTADDIAEKLGMSEYDLKDPKTNKKFGIEYLRQLLIKFNGDPELALTAYHSGMGRVERLLKLTGGTGLSDIIDLLGPIGQRYANDTLQRA